MVAKRRIFGARIGPGHIADGRSEAGSRINRCERLDQRTLAASVLADEKRDTVRNLDPRFPNDLRNRGDRVRPSRRIGWLMRVRRPVDVFEVSHVLAAVLYWSHSVTRIGI